MKNLLSTLLFANVLLTSFSQELPELTLEKGAPYYRFTHKLENENKCLRAYFDSSDGNYGMLINLGQETVNYSFTVTKKKIANGVFLFNFNKFSFTGNCIDTLKL